MTAIIPITIRVLMITISKDGGHRHDRSSMSEEPPFNAAASSLNCEYDNEITTIIIISMYMILLYICIYIYIY